MAIISTLVPQTTIWLALGYAAATASLALVSLERADADLVRHFDDELRLLSCGRLWAAERNLQAAAVYLAGLHPDAADTLSQTAADAGARLRRHYADVIAPLLQGRADAWSPDADVVCLTVAPDSGLAVRLVLQTHPGQPPSWPNWVAHLAVTTQH